MSNRTALIVGICITVAILFDIFLRDGDGILFLAIKGDELIEWMAFWR